MKKRYSDPKNKWLERRRQLKNIERIRRRNLVVKLLNENRRRNRARLGGHTGARPYRDQKPLTAPANFSFIDNTAEMVGFLRKMAKAFKGGFDVFVDFSGISRLTPDSLAVFVSAIKDSRVRGNCSGNEPTDERLKKLFIESGFYEIVVPRDQKKPSASGSFRKRTSKRVQPTMADEMVTFATNSLFGEYRKCGGVTNALLETMGNTRGHAASGPEYFENWWAYVHCDKERKIAAYCVVDNGIGIFRSRKISRLRATLNKVGRTSNIEILKKMLRRQIESSTGVAYRGWGIPKIYDSLRRGSIRNLIFIANDVIALVEKDEYRTLPTPFSGTFVYWEYHGEPDGKVSASSG